VNAFRNRLGGGNLSITSPFGENTSQGSRFITKLSGINRDQDIISMQAQEEMFQNTFEKEYTKLEKLGEGCSSEVIKCENKKSS
jgi:hypothetical protein